MNHLVMFASTSSMFEVVWRYHTGCVRLCRVAGKIVWSHMASDTQ